MLPACNNWFRAVSGLCLNGHPPLGVNATVYSTIDDILFAQEDAFQWAPTLGGECYWGYDDNPHQSIEIWFQWAPTLGGECYIATIARPRATGTRTVSMGTHPWG